MSFSIALIIGLLFLQRTYTQLSLPASTITPLNPHLPWLFFGIGILTYLIVLPFSGFLPSFTSIVSNMTNLQVVGIVLGIWQGIKSKNSRKILFWLALSPILPFITVSFGGFLGFGIASVIVILVFLFSRIRLQWWYVPIIAVILYFGMSLYITYVDGRGEIREVVWGNEEYSERLNVLNSEFSEWQWFDWRNQEHLAHIDGRLNQNFLTGAARVNLDNRFIPYAEGETIRNALVAFIPRIIWPDKPIVAGGSEIVTRYTLMDFAFGTTVSAGQAMEFYINYGLTGVVIGFALIGFVFAWLDSRSAYHLDSNNLVRFLRWYLIGMALLKPVDDLTVMTAGAASALVTSFLLEYALKWWFGRQSRPQLQTPGGATSAPALAPPRR